MITRTKKLVASLFATALLFAGLALPASAQPVVTGGLVNVTITNVANNNTVTVAVPINAAAAICGVDVNVLSALEEGEEFNDCTARGNQNVSVTG